MNEQVTTPWQGNWQERLQTKLRNLGHSSLEEFICENPGLSYVKLAALLGGDIAPMQLYGEQLRNAARIGQLRSAAKDCLVRFLNEHIKRGWGRGRHFLHRSGSAFAAWSTSVASHGQENGTRHVQDKLKAVYDSLEHLNPEDGWIPATSDDALIEKAFDEGWPT